MRGPPFVMQQGVPSLALAVVHGDRRSGTKVFGHAELGASAGDAADALTCIGSVTRPLPRSRSAVARGGKLRRRRSGSRSLTTTAIQARNSRLLDVTIRELLTHSSGLQRDLRARGGPSRAFRLSPRSFQRHVTRRAATGSIPTWATLCSAKSSRRQAASRGRIRRAAHPRSAGMATPR